MLNNIHNWISIVQYRVQLRHTHIHQIYHELKTHTHGHEYSSICTTHLLLHDWIQIYCENPTRALQNRSSCRDDTLPFVMIILHICTICLLASHVRRTVHNAQRAPHICLILVSMLYHFRCLSTVTREYVCLQCAVTKINFAGVWKTDIQRILP